MPRDENRNPFDGFACPVPNRGSAQITLEHGAGGRHGEELLEQLFLPAFDNPVLNARGDAAVIDWGSGRLAVSTDSYVVRPLFFPGGSIGHLAVHGTVNDLAMMGATPRHLTAGFILEEGFPIESLRRVVEDMATAAKRAGVTIVAGDTKVVDRGHGDGCYLNTAGIGAIPEGVHLAPSRARPGDAVLISGPIGNHGMAIMSVREGLEFDSEICSDTAPLNDLVSKLLAAGPGVRALRDPTRGGLAASLNEIATASDCGIVIEEDCVPVDANVAAACEVLGLDPMYVANEGKLVCFAATESGAELLAVMRASDEGCGAAIIGTVVSDHPGMVVARTSIGGTRVVTPPMGQPLPRIC